MQDLDKEREEIEEKENFDRVEQRKKKFLSNLKSKKDIFVYVILAFIVLGGYFIRLRNLSFLRDSTTNQFIPLALDPFNYLRYAEYIVEHGKLFAVDTMRYFPLGANMNQETVLLPYFNLQYTSFNY